ncbi:E3 ubiquitin-protein ligase TRIM17-like [Mixophyes fleayi]|uniref:E3 ubiquitin-protein ligase TRIM17-like n=1 Tax=Mixophyes fleayi TaxID=3061075 RepID=UPI003F4DC904
MASEIVPVDSGLYDDLKCSVCSDMLKDPVTLECMHHFCTSCFIRLYGNSTGCPHCLQPISCFAVKPNPLLLKIVELIKACTSPQYFSQVQNDLKLIIRAKERHIQFLTREKQEAQQKICSAKENGEKIRLKIAKEFQHLHARLVKEEETLLSSVDREEAAVVSPLQDTVQNIEQQIQSLADDFDYIQDTLNKTGDSPCEEADAIEQCSRIHTV